MSDIYTHSINPGTELELIQRKRSALQKLVRLTAMFNRLLQGLQAVLLTGRPMADIPAKIVEQFQSLEEKLQDHSTDTLKNTLSNTDIKIQSDLKQVLQLARMDETELSAHLGSTGSRLLDKLNLNFETHAGDFKKKAQTSIALRLVLKTRNILTKAFRLPVPESFIEQQIVTLDIRERECKARIQRDMSSLDQDLDKALLDKNNNAEVKQQLMRIKTGLQDNMRHFAAGKQLDEMPILFESIELSAAPQDIAQIEASQQPVSISEQTPVKKLKKKSRHFFSRLWMWLKSPLHVKWRDTK